MKNMKIEINENQTLDEVVMELERLGFKRWDEIDNPRLIVCHSKGMTYQMTWNDLPRLANYPKTTLAELKEMK